MAHGISEQAKVGAILREHRNRIRALEAVLIPVVPPFPDHVVFFDKDPQNDDWLGLHATGMHNPTTALFNPVLIGGTTVTNAGIALTSEAGDIWIGSTSPGGTAAAGSVRIATSTGGDIIIQAPVTQAVQILGGSAYMAGNYGGFSIDDTNGAGVQIDARGAGRPQDILLDVIYDSSGSRTPKIALRTEIYGDPNSVNEVVVYGGLGGVGEYSAPGVYIKLSDTTGTVGKFEIRDETGAPLLRVDPATGAFEIKTGAVWTATL